MATPLPRLQTATNIEAGELKSLLDDQIRAETEGMKSTEELAKVMNDLRLTLFKNLQLMQADFKLKVRSWALDQKYHKSFIESLRDKTKSTEGMFSVRNMLNKIGLVSKGGGGIVDSMLAKREAKQQYVKDVMKSGKATTPEAAAKMFERSNKLIGDLQKNEQIVKASRERGFVDVTAKKKAEEAREQLIQMGDPRVEDIKEKNDSDMAKTIADSISGALRELYSPKMGNPTATTAEGAVTPASSAANEELENEKMLKVQEQTDLLAKIEENTRLKPTEEKKEDNAVGFAKLAALGPIIAGIGKGIGIALKSVSAGIGEGIGIALKSIGTGIGGALASIGSGLAGFGRGAGAGFQLLFEGIAKGLSSLTAAAPAIPIILALSAAVLAIGKAIEWAGPVLMKFGEIIGGIFVAAIKEVPIILNSIGGVIESIGNSISKVIDSISSGITGGIVAIKDLIKTMSDVGTLEMGSMAIKLGAIGKGIYDIADGSNKLGPEGKSSLSLIRDIVAPENKNLQIAGPGTIQSAGQILTASAPSRETARLIAAKSAEIETAKEVAANKSSSVANVSAPTTVTTMNNNTFRGSSTRNDERSSSMLLASTYGVRG